MVIDARLPEACHVGHICGAINFPHRTMDAISTQDLDRNKVFVTYAESIGCNGSTKAARNLAALGFQVKELPGGLDSWKRDGHPLTLGDTPGEWPDAALLQSAVADSKQDPH